MGDPYWRYGLPPERGSIPGPGFPDFMPPETSAYTPHHLWSSSHLQSSSADYLHKDILPSRAGAYGVVDDINGASVRGYPSALEDPILLGQRRDIARGITPGIPDIISERPSSLRKVDDHPAVKGESNVLFVDGLPKDCSRREVSHLFRPFIGFREIRVVHKEPRRIEDKAMVLCFVEFADAKCALTALEALQGYKFDNKKPDSPVLRINFAHFPFRLPSDRDPTL